MDKESGGGKREGKKDGREGSWTDIELNNQSLHYKSKNPLGSSS